MEHSLYHYNANVTDVYDGDTITVNIDLGLGTWIHGEKIRLARINAPEVSGAERPQGLESRDFLRGKINGKPIVIQTVKDKKGKYGRYIADVWYEENGQWINASDELVSSGHAHYEDY